MRDGWEIKRLGDCLIKIVDNRGKTPQTTSEYSYKYGLLEINSTSGNDKFPNYSVIKKFVNKETYENWFRSGHPQKGDILFATVGTIGEIAILNENRGCIAQNLIALRSNANILNPNFLYYFLINPIIKTKLVRLNISYVQPSIRVPHLLDIDFPLPPLIEQERIVAKLDEAFAAIAKAKANAEQNLKNAKELFESYLQSVFENKGGNWKRKTLGDIAFVKSGGTPSRAKKEYWEGNIAWYSSGELNDLYTKEPERYINDLAINNSNAMLFPKGSLLIGMYDTAALKMSIIDRDATFNQAIAGVKPNDKIDLIFILHSINSIKPDLLNLRRGVRQKNLSLEKIKNIPIFLPQLETQQIIVQKLDALSTQTKKLEAIYQQHLNDLDELKKSILQKAFNGELKTTTSH